MAGIIRTIENDPGMDDDIYREGRASSSVHSSTCDKSQPLQRFFLEYRFPR